jgi:esterase FrsA
VKIRQLIALTFLLVLAHASRAQVPERTIDEIKEETLARAQRGAYPLGGIDPKDVAQALSLINTRDRDDWAHGWSEVARKYEEEGRRATSPGAAGAAYKRAWRLYYFAQWPVPNSQGKRVAYQRALDAYAKYGETLQPALTTVRIPFEGSSIVAYMRFPKEMSGPVPMVLAISGLDSRKETVAESYEQVLRHGVGFIAVDGPGTGQAPIKVSTTADRMFSAVLDFLAADPRVDRSRIIVSGASFGGYWAAKLAITEKARLLGSVAQSPPVDETFSVPFLRQTLGNREYLFDLVPAFLNVYEGVQSVGDLERIGPSMSLKAMGLLQKPTAPMLVVGGVKDTQVPIGDLELLMRSGDVPKDAWINPSGGHLGREARGWTDPVIFSKVIIPWELRLIDQSRR